MHQMIGKLLGPGRLRVTANADLTEFAIFGVGPLSRALLNGSTEHIGKLDRPRST